MTTIKDKKAMDNMINSVLSTCYNFNDFRDRDTVHLAFTFLRNNGYKLDRDYIAAKITECDKFSYSDGLHVGEIAENISNGYTPRPKYKPFSEGYMKRWIE